jgi:hypothetical protein
VGEWAQKIPTATAKAGADSQEDAPFTCFFILSYRLAQGVPGFGSISQHRLSQGFCAGIGDTRFGLPLPLNSLRPSYTLTNFNLAKAALGLI